MSDQRNKILGCACDLYLEEGRDGFSMRKLAERVGVTAPALYRHYESKDHVLADVLREGYRDFTGRLYRALEGRTPWERFRGASQAYLDFALENPRQYGMMFDSPQEIGMEGRMPEDVEAMGCAIHQFWVDRVRECIDAGLMIEGDPAQMSLTMWAHAHGLVQLYHKGYFRLDEVAFRRLVEESGARMMAGMATPTLVAELGAGRSEALPRPEPVTHTGGGAE